MIINGVRQINEEQLKSIIAKNCDDTLIIDVRERDEYVHAHIPGVPLISMHSIPPLISYFDKERSYVFVCHSGGRSQTVCEYMQASGIANVSNFLGGMINWAGHIQPGLEWEINNKDELQALLQKR